MHGRYRLFLAAGVCFTFLAGAFTYQPAVGAEQAGAVPERCLKLQVFIRGDSEICQNAASFCEEFSEQRSGICVEVLDVSADSANLIRYKELTRRFKVEKPSLPAFFACDRFKIGFSNTPQSKAKVEALFTIDAYVRDSCPHCRDAKRFLPKLAKRWPGIRIVYHNIDQETGASQKLSEMSRRYGTGATSLPGIFICGRFITGYQSDATTGRQYETLLRNVSAVRPLEDKVESEAGAEQANPRRLSLRNAAVFSVLRWGVPAKSVLHGASLMQVDSSDETAVSVAVLPEATSDELELPPVAEEDDTEETFAAPVEAPEGIAVPWFGYIRVRDWGLPAFTVLIGLVDGFNPCAMWVLVFLLSVLANVKDRRRIFAIAGTFVVVSGLAYFAFMAAWLNVFMFVGIARPLQIGFGLLAILIGVINVKDFFAFKKGVSLSIPESAKPGIYNRVRNIATAEYLSVAIWLSIVLAIAVNVVEFLCTAGLPALYTQILAFQDLPAWKNYAYLGLYILAYMFDDSVMVAIFVITLSRRKMQQMEGRWLKLISGAVVLLLGLVMVFRPDWLQW